MWFGRFLSMGVLVCALAAFAVFAPSAGAESLGPIKFGEKRIGDEEVMFCKLGMKQEAVDIVKATNETFALAAVENLSYENALQKFKQSDGFRLLNSFIDLEDCAFLTVLNHIPLAPVYEPPESQREFIDKAYPSSITPTYLTSSRAFESLALDSDQKPIGTIIVITGEPFE